MEKINLQAFDENDFEGLPAVGANNSIFKAYVEPMGLEAASLPDYYATKKKPGANVFEKFEGRRKPYFVQGAY